jgi:hypothetical protein
MKSQNTKTSNELKKEVHQELRKVRRDIDEIQNRLSPGKIIDDAIFSAHPGPLETFNHLKNNPVGTAFLSLGTILLMEDKSQVSFETLAKGKVSSGISAVKERVKQQMPHKELQPGETPNAADMAVGKIKGAKDSFQSKVEEIRNGLAAKIPDRDKLEQKKSQASDTLSAGKEKIKSLDNTTFMALGLGLGVVTGGSFPLSDTEEKMMSGKVDEKFSDFSRDLKHAMNECSNTLKDLFIHDVNEIDLKLF